MATGYVIWDQDEKQVVASFGTFKTSADADAATKRHINKYGSAPLKHNYSTVSVTVTRL